MKKSTTDNFFDSQKEKSKIKVHIVTEFFKTYFSIINNTGFSDEIYYIDLFCGPGKYKDGTKSTPLVLFDIIEAYKSDDIRNKLVMVFNDEDTEFYKTLTQLLTTHPVYKKLKHKPELLNKKASEVDLTKYYSNSKPKFSFIDPWGYIDVSAEQISKLVKSIGSDCVVFFNSNRILQDLSKPHSEIHMKKIFGDRYDDALVVQQDINLSQYEKAHGFVSLFSQNLYDKYFSELKEKGYKLFVLPFSVEQDEVEKISHYLLFISKNHKAVREMKKIMVKKSNTFSDLLGYDNKDSMSMSLFSREKDVSEGLRKLFAELFEKHPQLKTEKKTISDWLEYLDRYSMKTRFEVTPYTADELKKCIEIWDKYGEIDIEIPKNKKIRKRITDDRLLSFTDNFGR